MGLTSKRGYVKWSLTYVEWSWTYVGTYQLVNNDYVENGGYWQHSNTCYYLTIRILSKDAGNLVLMK